MNITLSTHPLGQTGLHIAPIGLGTVKFGRNTHVKYPQGFELPTDQRIQTLLRQCQRYRINLLDTAPAYGYSEQRIGQLLPGKRDDWVLCSKAGEIFDQDHSSYHFSQAHLHDSIKQSLQALRTDYLDIALIHSDGNDQHIIEHHDVFGSLAALKQQGYIRAYGMSTKTVAGGLLTVQHADVVMLSYHPQHTEEAPVLQAAHRANKGVLIKKALNSGHLQILHRSKQYEAGRPQAIGGHPEITKHGKRALSTPKIVDCNTPDLAQHKQQHPITQAMQCIFEQAGSPSVVLGTINPDHLEQNVRIVHQILKHRPPSNRNVAA